MCDLLSYFTQLASQSEVLFPSKWGSLQNTKFRTPYIFDAKLDHVVSRNFFIAIKSQRQ